MRHGSPHYEGHGRCRAQLQRIRGYAFHRPANGIRHDTTRAGTSWTRDQTSSNLPIDKVPITLQQVHQLIAETEAANEWANAPHHVVKMIEALNTNIWISCDHYAGVVVPATGSLAGVPLADLVAVVALSVVMGSVRNRLDALGLVKSFETGPAYSAMGIPAGCRPTTDIAVISIVDDNVFPIIAPAPLLLSRLATITALVYEVFRLHELTINFAPTKTAAIVSVAGAGAGGLKQSRELLEGQLQINTIRHTFALPIVHQYRHAGTIYARDLAIGPEIAQKA